jgi:hypothetical protein
VTRSTSLVDSLKAAQAPHLLLSYLAIQIVKSRDSGLPVEWSKKLAAPATSKAEFVQRR